MGFGKACHASSTRKITGGLRFRGRSPSAGANKLCGLSLRAAKDFKTLRFLTTISCLSQQDIPNSCSKYVTGISPHEHSDIPPHIITTKQQPSRQPRPSGLNFWVLVQLSIDTKVFHIRQSQLFKLNSCLPIIIASVTHKLNESDAQVHDAFASPAGDHDSQSTPKQLAGTCTELET